MSDSEQPFDLDPSSDDSLRSGSVAPASAVAETSPQKGSVLALLQLVRIPTVFTAMADIFLGFLLTHSLLEPLSSFVLLLGASVCIYWTGMILNDYFDRDVDRRDRPNRPIPSGRIEAAWALKLGVALNVVGVGLAASVGTGSLLVAVLLTACVWLYDGVLKKTPLAPVLMGSCRFFNVMLGASASSTGAMWLCPQAHVALGLGIYVCGLTWFARQEAKTSARAQLISASFVINAGLATLFGFVIYAPDNNRGETALFVLAVISFTIVRRLLRAISQPEPARVQTAIRTMLLSLIMLDATLVFFATGTPPLAIAVALLMVPAFLLSRWIPMT
ncbi:MAG: UbiA family prenyltransferase [Planctomycetota bacterium]|nr:UbiA family prenyltransferase [Planctomycetota bacterium]MDA1164043.1 UbiA family prenyltransferase [Planctomycetota bacterium]